MPPAVLAEVTALQRYADAWVPGSKNHQHPVCYGGSLLYRWQAERCAICGVTRRLIRDHDHGSGLLRGWLCLSCNAADGKLLSRPLFARYACRHPASMLGVRVTWRG